MNIKVKQKHGYKQLTLSDGRMMALFPNGKSVPIFKGGSTDDGGNEPDPTNPDGGGGEPKTEKVEYTPEQLAHNQKLIDDTFGKAYKKAEDKAEAKYGSDLKNANQQIEDLKRQVIAGNKKPQGNVIDPEELAAIDRQHKEEKAELQKQIEDNNRTLRQGQKNTALIDSLADKELVNMSDTMNLMKPFIEFDDEGNMIVLNENGNPRHSADGGLLSVADFADEFLSTRPNHFKGSQGGGGSQNAVFGDGSGKIKIETPEQYRALTREQKDALKKSGVPMNIGGREVSFKETNNPFINAKKRGVARDNRS